MKWLESDDGGVATEYAILGAVLALGFLAALTALGTDLNALYESVQDDVITALQ